MSRQKAPRNKAYRPKHIRLPMMQGLLDQFDTQLLVSLSGLQRGAPEHATDWHIDGIAKLINLVAVAQAAEKIDDARIIGARTVAQHWLDQYHEHGRFISRPHDLMTIGAAVQAAREYLVRADIMRLHMAMQAIKFVELKEARDAAHLRSHRLTTEAGTAPLESSDQPRASSPEPCDLDRAGEAGCPARGPCTTTPGRMPSPAPDSVQTI